ncbi:MAG: hypothetical protein WC277_09205 [Bacilli bacterium]
MRCKQCGRKMRVVRGRYAVCLRGCGRIVMFETSTVQPGNPLLAEVRA